jgi:hypothetical protein
LIRLSNDNGSASAVAPMKTWSAKFGRHFR